MKSHPHASFCFPNALYNNDDNGRALIFVGWMYVTDVVLVLDKQYVVRLYRCVCACSNVVVLLICVQCSVRS